MKIWIKILLLSSYFFLIGAICGYMFIVPGIDINKNNQKTVYIGNVKVNIKQLNNNKIQEIIDGISAQKIILIFNNKSYPLSLKRLGFQIDTKLLKNILNNLNNPDSETIRFLFNKNSKIIKIKLPYKIDEQKILNELLQIKDYADIKAQELKVDTNTKQIVDAKNGSLLDIYNSALKIKENIEKGIFRFSLVSYTKSPDLTRQKLSNLNIEDILGWFETPYSQTEEVKDRSFNLRFAASKIDGYILLPDKTFYFNDIVGERTEAKGFKVAPVISSGELVDGIGGGTCQVASTLHAAAFFAGLDVISRRPHSRPSSYIRLGLDATVAYPSIDLVLKNPYPFPVVFHFKVESGIARCEIWGPKRQRIVTFIRHVVKTMPFAEKIIEDENLPLGVKIITQKGIPGFELRRYKIINEDNQSWRDISYDIYPPTVQILRVGKNSQLKLTEAQLPHEDKHGEYPLPCDMRIIQGPDNLSLEQSRCD